MPVVDVHVHIYPEKIAARAVEAVGSFYGVSMPGGGTAQSLFELSAGSPVSHYVVHSVAVKPSNVESINNFIAASCAEHPEFIGFMTLHQDFPDPETEINRACGLGLRGIKLHPDMQDVDLDDPRLMTIYEIAQAKGLPLILHCGDYRRDHTHPRRTKRVLQAFPQLRLDAAHMGGWSVPDLALEYLENERCFLDMSSSQAFLGPRRMAELVRAYGCDRVLFGSDFPMWSPAGEYAIFMDTLTSYGFTDSEIEDMTWHNAERFLGMRV